MSREARASFQMIEMYLDPEIEVMWAQTGQGIAQSALQPNLEAVHAAQTLLQDVHVTEDVALRHQVHLPLLLPDTVVIGLMSCSYTSTDLLGSRLPLPCHNYMNKQKIDALMCQACKYLHFAFLNTLLL